MSKKNKLPNKPSNLIRLALKDLKAVERSKEYVVNMEQWHTSGWDNSKCAVCFAGSVMAKSLNVPISKHATIFSFDNDTRNKLDALDAFRLGEIMAGVQEMGKDLPFGMAEEIDVANYHINSSEFKKDMERIAKLFERFGL